MHSNARLLFQKYAVPLIPEKSKVLEVGPSKGNTILRDMLPQPDYHYCDIKNFEKGPGQIRMQGGYRIMAADSAFDVVFAAQVIEHVDRPWLWIPELTRVAAKLVIILCPVSYVYHPGPLDCWRIFSDGMRVLFTDAGLAIRLCTHESLDGKETDTIAIGEKL